ncbi:TPA: 1-acyl-sn-glycerol-3-phosphate acyltransferase [Candidatus Poribacteria bacterium]|nr:1-acyl-sn-glycerol-3-phosphate acyltransferase [Candidatus Poribacteria bacterium]
MYGSYSEKRFQNVLYRIAVSLFTWAFHLTVVGRENIPDEGGALIASNHVSYLDPPILGAASKRELFYMARDTLFRPKPIGDFLKYMNAFPVKRDRPDRGALKTAISLLESGKLVLVFPEGTRSHDGTLGRPHLGVGFIVYHSTVPVIPVYISGTERALPRGAFLIKRAEINVHFGLPINMEELRSMPRPREAYPKIGEKIMSEIAKLQARYRKDPGGK